MLVDQPQGGDTLWSDALRETVIATGILNQLRAIHASTGYHFEAIRLLERVDHAWVEVVYWDPAEWLDSATEAFEAIMGVVRDIGQGVYIDPKRF